MRMFTRLTCLCLCIVIAASMVSCTTGQGGAHFSRTVHFTDL